MISTVLSRKERKGLHTNVYGSTGVQRSREAANMAWPIAEGDRGDLYPARNVGGLVEHGNDHGRLRGAVGNPVAPGLEP